ncbi:MAG: hypothetical protein K2I72_00655, partial [Bacilli bacterium]|nr:hypothetical protein [Bacilli bacterium]
RYEIMIQKIAQIREEKKFEGVFQYELMDLYDGIDLYDQSIKNLEDLIKEYPNCFEEDVITEILNQAKETGRKANKSPNSYAHYQERKFLECVQERIYIKIGALHVNPPHIIGERPIPIRIYNYGINGDYATRIITDLNYTRQDDELECLGISYTGTRIEYFQNFVMTSDQIKVSGIKPVKLKSMIKEN